MMASDAQNEEMFFVELSELVGRSVEMAKQMCCTPKRRRSWEGLLRAYQFRVGESHFLRNSDKRADDSDELELYEMLLEL